MEGIRVEIVCARRDLLVADRLVAAMAMLRRTGVVESIVNQMSPVPDGPEATVFLVLTSDAVADDPEARARISHALGRSMEGRARVVPVWLDASPRSPFLAALQQTPRDRPVYAYESVDAGWVAVVTDLRHAFESWRR